MAIESEKVKLDKLVFNLQQEIVNLQQEIVKFNELNGIKLDEKVEGSCEARHMYTFTIQEINKTYGTKYVSEVSALKHYFKPTKPLEEN